MTQRIEDHRAPFPDVDTALAIGKEHMNRLARGGTPMGLMAEEQPGGYFVRISWSQPVFGSRASRHRRQMCMAEIGRIR